MPAYISKTNKYKEMRIEKNKKNTFKDKMINDKNIKFLIILEFWNNRNQKSFKNKQYLCEI